MGQPDFNAALNYALSRLENELSPQFLYHSCTHTRQDVLLAARNFARLSKVNSVDLHLLEIAAAFHDIGFLFTVEGHELLGAELARDVLVGFGLNPAQIEKIYYMILATRLPQNPQNMLEELLADADLDVLGREDFMKRNDLLRREIAGLGKTFTDEQWYSSQLKFMENHNYFSEAARRLRGEGKTKNMALLREKLENCNNIQF